MSSLNIVKQVKVSNHVGTPVNQVAVEKQLTRMTLAHMLWEGNFYIDGISSANIVSDLVAKAKPQFVADLATKARTEFKLRHIPLLLVRELARKGNLKAETVNAVIQRPDEMAELLSIYWKDGKASLSNQMKKGLATAFGKFNEYNLAKWDKNSASISVRDVMFLVRPKPANDDQAQLFTRVANRQLVTPDTWETQLSAGADKGATFSRLMAENKLGALAFLRNLRNMVQSNVPEAQIRDYAKTLDVSKVLPFRFLAAARVVPQFEDMLEAMMFKSCESLPKFTGKTVALIDVSGSMFGTKVSAKSDLDRFDAAAALAVVLREQCEQVEFYTFSRNSVRVAPRRGFALVEALRDSQQHGGTYIGIATQEVNSKTDYDRMVIVTDEQSYDQAAKPKGKGYLLNVGSYQNGIASGKYTTITGFSEAVFSYMHLLENE
jgi:60 kDa SS-A/Ro ribonucleoprotein